MNAMKHTLIASAATAICALAGTGAALAAGQSEGRMAPAADSKQQGTPGSSRTAVAPDRDVRAQEMIGAEVKNTEGRKLGEIHDLVMDTSSHRIRYAILSHGGIMNIGDKLFAYPVSAFRLADQGRELVLNVPRERLENAPGFDTDAWPDFNDAGYRGRVDRHFGEATAQGAHQLARVSEMLDVNLEDRNGRSAGELKDLVFNLSDARVRYAVIDFDDGWRDGERSEVRAGSEPTTMARAPRTDRDMSTTDRSPAVSTTTGTTDTTTSTGTPSATGTTAASPTIPASPTTTTDNDRDRPRVGEAGELHAVRPSALKWTRQGDDMEAVVNLEPSQLAGRQGFDESQLQNLNDPSFKQRLRSLLGDSAGEKKTN